MEKKKKPQGILKNKQTKVTFMYIRRGELMSALVRIIVKKKKSQTSSLEKCKPYFDDGVSSPYV